MAPRKKAVRNELNLVYRKVKDLKMQDNNAKIHEDYDVDVIGENISKFKFKIPFVIDKDNVIVCGHGRKLAITKMGRENEEFACVLADDLTPEEIELFRISENNSSEKAGQDYEILSSILSKFKELDVDLPALGFDNFFDNEGEVEEADDPVYTAAGGLDNIAEGVDTSEKKKTFICPHCGQEIEL